MPDEIKIKEFKRKKNKEDLLGDLIELLKNTQTEEEFYYLLSEKLRGGKGKDYKNIQKFLPKKGRYQEFEVKGSQDSRRIVVDMDSKKIFATRDHYETMSYAGIPFFKETD